MGFITATLASNGNSYFDNQDPDPPKKELQRRREAEECSNCGSIFKGCNPGICPFGKRDGTDWAANHHPMRVTKEMMAAAKSKLRIANPAVQEPPAPATDPDDEDAICTPLVALGFPDEPPLPAGLYCGAVVRGDSDHPIHMPCMISPEADEPSESVEPPPLLQFFTGGLLPISAGADRSLDSGHDTDDELTTPGFSPQQESLAPARRPSQS